MQRLITTTLLPKTPQAVRQTLRGVLPILGALAILIAFPPAARALDFDPETVQVSELFPENSYVNPRDFGATGDGETDDTAAILAAIDAINANGEGVLVLENGEFYCPSWPEEGKSITVPIAIQGDSATLIGDGSARLFDLERQFLMEGLRIENWRVGTEFYKVGRVDYTDNSDWVIIRGNSFESVNHPIQAYRSGSFRAELSDATDPHRISLVLITRNVINNAKSGITIAVIHVEDIIISRNTIENILRIDYDSDPDVLFTILSAIRIGMDGENIENGQKISNVNILENVIRNIHNKDPVRDRAYGILNYRGPDRIAGNWLQNFRAATGRAMGIYTRSASDAITEDNILIDVSSDVTDTGQPSRGAISSKKNPRLHHLVRGNTIIFTEKYKSEINAYRYVGILFKNHNIEFRDNLLIGCVGGGINIWSLSGSETSDEKNLIYDNNILIGCTGDAFSNFYGRQELRISNNTLIRHDGVLYAHRSVAESDRVKNLIIEGNQMFQQRGTANIIGYSGYGIRTDSFIFRNNIYQHIGTLDLESFDKFSGGGHVLGRPNEGYFTENSVIEIVGNTIIGLKRDWDHESNISPTYLLSLETKIAALSITENYLEYGHRILNAVEGVLPDSLIIRANHIKDWTDTFSHAGGTEPGTDEWDTVNIDFTSNTGNFSTEQVGNYFFEATATDPLREYTNVPAMDSAAARVAERISNLQDDDLKAELRSNLEFLIGSVSTAWTFQAPGQWGL